MKKIYRSQENKIISGIFGGIGEYFDIDPAIFRLVGLALCIATGVFPFILIYILAYFIIPNKKIDKTNGEIKKLYRSKDNAIFAGIFGGLGDYFNIDPTIIRLFALLICILTAIIPFIILYIVACFIIPLKDEEVKSISKNPLLLITFILLLIVLTLSLIFISVGVSTNPDHHFFERYGLEL